MDSSLIDWNQRTPVYLDSNNVYHYDAFKSQYKNIRFILRQSSTYTVTKKDMGRIATISYNIYGTTTFWRILLEYNQIHDPITELYPGVTLAVPDKAQATAYLANSNSSAGTMTSSSSRSFTI